MRIRLQVPRVLQACCGDAREISTEGATVAQLLQNVQREYPELHRSICDETGKLRQHINLFINNDLFDRRRMDTRLDADDVVSVFQAVSGG